MRTGEQWKRLKMPWPYEEYPLLENLLLLIFLIIPPVVVYFIIRPILFSHWERRSGPIEEGTDAPDEEYWRDDWNRLSRLTILIRLPFNLSQERISLRIRLSRWLVNTSVWVNFWFWDIRQFEVQARCNLYVHMSARNLQDSFVWLPSFSTSNRVCVVV